MAENIEKLILDDSGFITPLNESIKKLNETEQALKSLNQTSQKETAKTAAELKKSSDSQIKALDDLKRGVSSQVKTYEDQKRAVSEVAGAILKSGDTAAKFSALIKKLEAFSLKGATMSVQDLEKEFTDLLETAKLTDDQIEFLTNNIEDVAAEIAGLDISNIEELANETEQTTEKFKTAKSELRELTNLINSGQLTGVELEQAEARAARLTDEIGDVRNKLKLLASDTRGLDLMVESITAVGAGFQIVEGAAALYGDESKELQETLIRLNAVMAIANGLQQAGNILTTKGGIATKAATGFQKLWTVAVGEGTGAMKVFRTILAGLGIGLVIAGLTLLITNFDKVKEKVFELVTGLEKIGSVVAGVWESIKTTFGNLGDLFGNLFSGDFSGAMDEFKNLGKDARASFNEGFQENEAQKARDGIAKDLENLAKSQRRRAEILEAGGKDSYKVIESATANELAALKLRGEEAQKIQDKQLELELLQTERRAKIEEERKRKLQEFTKSFKDTTKEILGLAGEFNVLTEQEKFDVVKQQTIERFKELRAELVKTGQYLGKDFSIQLAQIDTLIKGIESRKFVPEGIEKLPSLIEKSLKGVKLETPKVKTPEFSENAAAEFTGQWERLLEDIGDDWSSLLDFTLSEIFKDSDIFSGEDARIFLNGAGTLVNEFGNILNEATDLQIDAIDKQIDKLSKRKDKLQDDLDKELELQKEGLANNVGLKQQEVDGLLAEEKRLLAEREKIQREAQKRQLIAESVQQGASLVTASIDIIKGFSKIPFVGLPLGIAAVASLFGFFAATKAKAFKATKLYKGADKISDHFGFGDRHGDSDLPGQGEGYSLVNRRTGMPTNVVISGKEMLLPESISLPNEQFFASLKSGKYKGVDLNSAMNFYMNYKDRANSVNKTVVNNFIAPNHKKDTNVRIGIPHTTKRGKKGIIITTIKEDMKDGSFIEIDF